MVHMYSFRSPDDVTTVNPMKPRALSTSTHERLRQTPFVMIPPSLGNLLLIYSTSFGVSPKMEHVSSVGVPNTVTYEGMLPVLLLLFLLTMKMKILSNPAFFLCDLSVRREST
jgi:hypothetical protein